MWPSSHLDRLCFRVRVNDVHKIDAIQVRRDAFAAIDPSGGTKHRLTCGEALWLHDGPRSPFHSLRDGICFHLNHIHKISHLFTMQTWVDCLQANHLTTASLLRITCSIGLGLAKPDLIVHRIIAGRVFSLLRKHGDNRFICCVWKRL